MQNIIETNTWTLGMPYWDGIWDSDRPDAYQSYPEAWEQTKMYCDIESRETIAQYEGEDCIGMGMGGGYDWCRYTWTEDGQGAMSQTTDELWWCLDDLLWGPLYWGWYHADGRELSIGEHRQSRGLPADDLLYELKMIEIGKMMENLRRPGA